MSDKILSEPYIYQDELDIIQNNIEIFSMRIEQYKIMIDKWSNNNQNNITEYAKFGTVQLNLDHIEHALDVSNVFKLITEIHIVWLQFKWMVINKNKALINQNNTNMITHGLLKKDWKSTKIIPIW